MKHTSPIRNWLETYARSLRPKGEALREVTDRPGAAEGRRDVTHEAEFLPYGPADDDGAPICEILATCGEVEAEYAAIRRGAGLLDCPNRATLVVSGADRTDFLNRMVTQDLATLSAGDVRQGFLLGRTGRIEADVRIAEFGEFALLDVDVHQAEPVMTLLEDFLFSEDVQIRDAREAFHHMEVHGPRALEAIGAATDAGPLEVAPGTAVSLALDDAELFVMRIDLTGEPGLILIAPRTKAEAVWVTLMGTDEKLSGGKRRIRPVGWFAFNIARIEAGTPLMNIDFGPPNLPHETGVLRERVSFTKGCYPGQEVVARMENLGRPKQMLVGLKMHADKLPVAGGQVFSQDGGVMGDPVGIVTSSTLSPMLGAEPIAFGMVKAKAARDGGTVLVNAEGEQVEARVQELAFLPQKSGSSRP